MEAFLREFEHLKIQLRDLQAATDNFNNQTNLIGSGGFGKVYRGEVSFSKGRSLVAIKRLDRKFGQGDPEFWKEIMMLSRYSHENLISLLGYCDEFDKVTKIREKLVVYEHAFNGSLDRHLSSTSLSWAQRIRICLDAATGLCYLHDETGTQQRVVHRDIKSSNILLDQDWKAKISDMGLSKLAPANQEHTAIITNAVGTMGYIDPMYHETNILTKESDVYSFGVVLFEVLCGRLCTEKINGRYCSLVRMWKQSYTDNKLSTIIFKNLTQPIDPTCLKTFSDIAFQCLQELREDRPRMSRVVEQLNIALQHQSEPPNSIPEAYAEIIKAAVSPIRYRSKEDLRKLLSQGILLNGGNTWFSINSNDKHYELISLAECLIPEASASQYSQNHNSRFAVGSYKPNDVNPFKTRVKPQFLSPGTTYTVNLVFQKYEPNEVYIGLEYRLDRGRKCYSFLSNEIENGWMTAELYQFTTNQSGEAVDLEITFYIKHCDIEVVEGIEFRPLEKVENKVVTHEGTSGGSVTYWEEEVWIDNIDGKKYHILPTRVALKDKTWKYLPQTRAEEVVQDASLKFHISWKIESDLWPHQSSETTYATYLVYKQRQNEVQPRPIQLKDKNSKSKGTWNIYLHIPQTPVIISGKIDAKNHLPSHRPKIESLPKQRRDGWMEVQIWGFQTNTNSETFQMNLKMSSYDESLEGIELKGIEFRPIGKF